MQVKLEPQGAYPIHENFNEIALASVGIVAKIPATSHVSALCDKWLPRFPGDGVSAVVLYHSITSSARASSDCGTSIPSALAVFRLIASSYLVGACTGMSAGFSSLEDAVNVISRAPVLLEHIRSIRN